MYSMKRISAPRAFAKSSSGMISSSLTPRMMTESILKPGKGSTAASMPASTRGSSSNRASLMNRSRCSGIEADGETVQARRLEIVHRGLQQHCVGRHREIANRALARQLFDKCRQIAAEQRLAASQPHLVDAKEQELIDEPLDLFELKDVFARQPEVVLLRHAVLAAQVAPVGDRQPQVRQRPVMRVKNGHGCPSYRSGRGQARICAAKRRRTPTEVHAPRLYCSSGSRTPCCSSAAIMSARSTFDIPPLHHVNDLAVFHQRDRRRRRRVWRKDGRARFRWLPRRRRQTPSPGDRAACPG